jgi:hypothetical protein
MGDVLDRWRLNLGWKVLDDRAQVATIASYCHTLDRAGVPPSAYGELYERAIERRAASITASHRVPDFGVELLLAEWHGPHGLRADIKKREVARRRTLPETAESQCERCFGLGVEEMYNAEGERIGARPGCKHEPVVEGEGLWLYKEKLKQQVDRKLRLATAIPEEHPEEMAITICTGIVTQLGYDVQDARDDVEKAQIREAWLTWIRARKYVRERLRESLSPAGDEPVPAGPEGSD